ncbi:MAG: TlpA family protein disulfide reductase [Ilumatobacteraceae bacterium]
MLWLWIGIAVVVVIVVAAVVAIVSSGGDEDLSVGSVPPSGETIAPGGESKGEVWPVTVSGTALTPLPQEGTDPGTGETAPTISGFAFDGSPVTLDWSKGPTMVVVVAHWCPHCNVEVPELVAWKNSGEVPPELQVIAISTNANPQAPNYPPSEWLKDKGWTWPVLADDENSSAAQAMGVSFFPYVAIIGTDGKVLTRWSGEKGQDAIDAMVDAALA